MIYFDLDGVLRDITQVYLGYTPSEWNCGIMEKIRLDPSLLLKAPPTEYYPIVKEYFENKTIYIITCQIQQTRKYTIEWVNKHFRNVKLIQVKYPEEKLKYLKKGDTLIEDYPFYKPTDISHITLVLIDKPYNKSSICHLRIHSPKALKYFLYSKEKFKRYYSISKKKPLTDLLYGQL